MRYADSFYTQGNPRKITGKIPMYAFWTLWTRWIQDIQFDISLVSENTKEFLILTEVENCNPFPARMEQICTTSFNGVSLSHPLSHMESSMISGQLLDPSAWKGSWWVYRGFNASGGLWPSLFTGLNAFAEILRNTSSDTHATHRFQTLL